MRRIPTLTILLALPLTLALSACCEDEPAGLSEAREFYAARPVEERPKGGFQTVPEGLPDLRAATCGGCHTAIYDEWRVSTHGLAWVDPQFQQEITKSGNRWLCNNCHTPLLNQMEQWAVGLDENDVEKPRYVPNPDYDPAFRDEGITCASCHVRGGVIEGPTGAATPAHATRKAARFLDQTLCLECHQAVREYPGKTFTCVFNTGEEWKAGPFGKAAVSCQSCHMQEVERPVATGAASRRGRRHFFPGAGIPKFADKAPPLDQLFPGMDVAAVQAETALQLTLTNRAGHMLPTGDPERFITVTIRFVGPDDALIKEEVLRIGQLWEWWPAPKKLDDNRLTPGESRPVSVRRPDTAVAWTVEVRSHRINGEAAAYHGLADYPASRQTQKLEGRWEVAEAPGEVVVP